MSQQENLDRSLLAEHLQQSLHDDQALQTLLADHAPVEIATALSHESRALQPRLIERLPSDFAARVLREIDPGLQQALIHELSQQTLTRLLATMEPDDAADIVGLLPEDDVTPLLHQLPDDNRVRITTLLRYPEDSAGGLMDPDVVKVRQAQTIAEATESIRHFVASVQLEDFFSIYVLDDARRLVGVVPTSRVILATPEQTIAEIMNPNVLAVDPHMDQEEVARLVRQHDLISVPVVDHQGRLLGRITVDDVVDVIREEFDEDLGRLSGTGTESVLEPSLFYAIRGRSPWLMLALIGQFFVAGFMASQETLLRTLTQLTFFVPLIMAMAGNAGIQSSTLAIRGLATGEVLPSDVLPRLLRETLIASLLGIIFALFLVLGGFWLTGQWRIGITVGLSTCLALLIAVVFGTTAPMLLKRMGIDPALATGPFLTTANDILALVVYLLLARWLVF